MSNPTPIDQRYDRIERAYAYNARCARECLAKRIRRENGMFFIVYLFIIMSAVLIGYATAEWGIAR